MDASPDLPDPSSQAGRELDGLLLPGETVIASAHSRANDLLRTQYLIATNQRVIIIKPKLLGVESHTYPYTTLIRVENSDSMLQTHGGGILVGTGYVELITAAQPQTYRIQWGKKAKLEAGGNVKKHNLPNVFAYGLMGGQKEAISQVVAVINRYISQGQSPATPAINIPDQLRQLAELRKAGIITQEAYDAKKAELLSRM